VGTAGYYDHQTVTCEPWPGQFFGAGHLYISGRIATNKKTMSAEGNESQQHLNCRLPIHGDGAHNADDPTGPGYGPLRSMSR